MIADEGREEGCRFRGACIRGDKMDAIRGLVEAISSLIDGLLTALHLHPHCPTNHIANDRTRVAVRCGKITRRIRHLDRGYLKMGAVQPRQGLRKRCSRAGTKMRRRRTARSRIWTLRNGARRSY